MEVTTDRTDHFTHWDLTNEGNGLRAVFYQSAIDAIVHGQQESDPDFSENDIFTKGWQTTVFVKDPETEQLRERQLGTVADIGMRNNTLYNTTDYMLLSDGLVSDDLLHDGSYTDYRDLVGLPADQTIAEMRGRRIVQDNRDGIHTYRYYRYRVLPGADMDPNCCITYYNEYYDPAVDMPEGFCGEDEAVYHWPYRHRSLEYACSQCGNDNIAVNRIEDYGQPFYVTVVEESENGVCKHVRAVEMNVAGFVLRDRTWSYEEDPNGQLVEQKGYGEHRFYDRLGRLIALGSEGYGSEENQIDPNADPMNDGLVYRYEYTTTDESGEVGELAAIGVQKGFDPDYTAGDPITETMYYIRSYGRDCDRSDLVTKETSYPVPVTSKEDPSGIATEYIYQLDANRDDAVTMKTAVRPAALRNADDATPYYAVEKTKYDDSGQEVYFGAGSLADPASLNGAAEFFVNYHEYDENGSDVTLIEIDTVPDVAETEFQRVVTETALADPLDLQTHFEYGGSYGLEKVVYPNGREMHIRYGWIQEGTYNNLFGQWIFRDVIPGETQEPGDPPTSCRLLSPVELNIFDGGELSKKLMIAIDSLDHYPPEIREPYTDDQVISISDPQYDEHGNLVTVSQTGGTDENAPSLTAYISYHSSGQIAREQDPDGTITRHVYDERGRLQRTYRGTNDADPYWGTCTQADPEENMTLIEKRYYGEGLTDANRLIRVRHFRDKPNNQYFTEWDGGACAPGEEPPNCTGWWADGQVPGEDQTGWTTEHYHDWRMREVWVERWNEMPSEGNPDPADQLNTTVTWFDHQDRVRLVAEYDGAGPEGSAVDPRLAEPDDTEPTAAAILGVSVVPISLTETIYNRRGQVEETRNYSIDSAAPDPDNYTATVTYYDFRGKPIEVRSPNSPAQRYVYDAKGRQVASSSWAAGIELTRTETQYDRNDRAIVSIYFERLDGTTGALDQHAVKSFTHTWYDDAGKVIATANYGTNNATYTTGTEDPPAYDADPDNIPDGSGGELVTRYGYDEAGRQDNVIHPDGTVTRYKYDGLGRLLMTTENAEDASEDLVRRTAYQYDDSGRLSQMAAVLPGNMTNEEVNWTATDGTLQVTQFVYGADVLDVSGTPISTNNAWIQEVKYPHPGTGSPDPDRLLHFSYYSDGSIATREDARGVLFNHTYDNIGRRTNTTIEDSAWFNPVGSLSSDWLPPYRIQEIEYEYNAKNALTLVTALGDDPDYPGTPMIVAQNRYDYDENDNLEAEWQQHFDTVGVDTPVIDYAWDFVPFDPEAVAGAVHNYNRLASMTYPARAADDSRRTIEFDYGNGTTDLNHALSRVTAMTDTTSLASMTYDYAGISRRISKYCGNGVNQTFRVDGEAYAGLDRFGRVADLHYIKSGVTRHQYQYGYDAAGNRTHARVTQATINNNTHINDRSYLYAYDALHRLIAASLGSLNENNNGMTSTPTPVPWSSIWYLDNLGNWSGNETSGSFQQIGDFDFNGVADTNRYTHHDTNFANEIDNLIYDDGSGDVTTAFVHDIVGNLVFDGTYWYQYDAWNRLVQVNHAGTLSADDFDDDGQLSPLPGDPDPHVPGDPVAQFVYDGLGRLIRQSTDLDADAFVETDLYYDGVRRISEQSQEREQAVPPLQGMFEMLVQTVGDPITVDVWDELEYVWDGSSIGASGGYVDEIAFVLTDDKSVRYALLDANYNLMGWMRPNGGVMFQYVYGPYGDLRAADKQPALADFPPMAIGHQGLFFVRFDGNPGDAPLTPPNAITGERPRGLYYNRNRWYSPELGRFTTKDVNETALPILTAYAFNGDAIGNIFGGFNAQTHYADGMNLYLYQGGNPVNLTDALGLTYDDSWLDEFTNDYVGHRLYALGAINEGARLASIGLQTSLDIAGSLLGVDVFQSVAVLASGQGGFWEAMDILMTVNPIGRLGKVGGILGKAFKWGRRGGHMGSVVGKAAEHLFKILPYKQAKKLTAGFAGEIQAHHILETRHARRLKLNPDDIPAVILPREEHQRISQALQSALPCLGEGRPYSPDEIRQAYRKVYKDYPEWLQAIESYIR